MAKDAAECCLLSKGIWAHTRSPESGSHLAEGGPCTPDPNGIFKTWRPCVFRQRAAPGLARGTVKDFSLSDYDISSLWEVLKKIKLNKTRSEVNAKLPSPSVSACIARIMKSVSDKPWPGFQISALRSLGSGQFHGRCHQALWSLIAVLVSKSSQLWWSWDPAP